MAWMIPIKPNRHIRGAHIIGILISFILLFMGLSVFFFSSISLKRFNGFTFHSVWIVGGIVFLISIFIIVGIIAALANVSSEKTNSYKHNPNEFNKLNPKINPYLIRRPSQSQLEVILHEKSEIVAPNPQVIQFCRYCGSKLDQNSKFCQECGMKVEK